MRLADELNRKNIKIITRLEPSFSNLLLQIVNVPCILYYCGDISLLNRRSLAIVGARKASTYGLKQAHYMSGELARHSITITSGLARGIDGMAHRGALEQEGDTIAVLGSGLDVPYPRENKELFSQICDKGLVISEFPPGTPPLNVNFPIRNRIISGISTGVFVIEARARSGSLITCDCALEQGKDIYALPGPVTSSNSIGPLRLIQSGAKLVLYPADILEEMGYKYQQELFIQREKKVHSISKEEKEILKHLSWEPYHLNVLFEKSRCSPDIQGILLNLELKGLIKQLPGKYYVRI